MKNKVIQTQIEVYSSAEDLSQTDAEALKHAHKIVNNAYAPYSKFQVAAVVKLKNGALIGGTNQENAAYPMCLCAESAALAAAASAHPNTPIDLIAITVKHPEKPVKSPAAPCGSCRQVLSEMEDRYGQDIQIIMQGEEGEIFKVQSAKDLLPLSFGGEFL